ncbi:MAG: hypothetical protein Q7U74_15465 [Saprospiraceae bacterium]|nr:hypothetical protein [Saprospiraceae bacterium]
MIKITSILFVALFSVSAESALVTKSYYGTVTSIERNPSGSRTDSITQLLSYLYEEGDIFKWNITFDDAGTQATSYGREHTYYPITTTYDIDTFCPHCNMTMLSDATFEFASEINQAFEIAFQTGGLGTYSRKSQTYSYELDNTAWQLKEASSYSGNFSQSMAFKYATWDGGVFATLTSQTISSHYWFSSTEFTNFRIDNIREVGANIPEPPVIMFLVGTLLIKRFRDKLKNS